MVLCLMDSAQGTEVSSILGYDEASLGDLLPTLRDDIVVVFFESECPRRMGTITCLQSSVVLVESLFTCGMVQFYE